MLNGLKNFILHCAGRTKSLTRSVHYKNQKLFVGSNIECNQERGVFVRDGKAIGICIVEGNSPFGPFITPDDPYDPVDPYWG